MKDEFQRLSNLEPIRRWTTVIFYKLKGRSEQGFVLVAVIWIVAAMSLFVGYVASSAQRLQDQVFELHRGLAQGLADRSTESVILYLGSTRRVTYAGLVTELDEGLDIDPLDPFSSRIFDVEGGELRLDGRPYHGLDGITFAIQDTGGLISLMPDSRVKRERLASLLREFEIPQAEAERLVALLQDYTDRDDLISLDGAETASYLDRGLLAPTHQFLVSPAQISNILDWPSALNGYMSFFLTLVTIDTGNQMNFNTAPPIAMSVMSGLDNASIQRVLEYRKSEVFESILNVNEVAGSIIFDSELAMMPLPNSFFRLRLWHQDSRHEKWIGIKFTPMSALAPWEINYRIVQPRFDLASENHPQYLAGSHVDATIPESILFR